MRFDVIVIGGSYAGMRSSRTHSSTPCCVSEMVAGFETPDLNLRN